MAIIILGIIIVAGIGYAASVGSPAERMVADTSPNSTGGAYVDYSDSLVQQMLADGKRVVLFFHAAWCPTCNLADRRIQEAAHQIPSDVAIFKVDYDREESLVDAYGVLYQHTFVQLTEGGALVTKFQGSSTLPAILANIQ